MISKTPSSSRLTSTAPETYFLPPTKYAPNSPLPVLVYRNVIPDPLTEESCQAFIEEHGWEREGPVWKAIYKRHFHPNVHECYGIISGTSQVLMGLGTGDIEAPNSGLRFTLHAGDVVVHPAGTAHSNVTDEGEYRYMSFFSSWIAALEVGDWEGRGGFESCSEGD